MSTQAQWSDDDIDVLIAFLWQERATAGDGMSFKSVIWNEVSVKLSALPARKGGKKTAGSCKSKWGKLKEIFHIVANIKAQSGFKWSDEFGADIHEESAAVWDAYEQRHKGSAPFRNKGWSWYDRVLPLMPTTPRGANVYRASTGSQQPPRESTEPVEPAQDPDDERPISDWEPTPPPEQLYAPAADAAPEPIFPPLQTPTVGIKRRQSALPPSTVFKRPRGSDPGRPSGAAALHGMNDRLDEFTDVFRDTMSGKQSGVDATPVRKTRAMKRVQELETMLSDHCVVALIDLFQDDVKLADAYLSLTREGVRNKWVHAHTKAAREAEAAVHANLMHKSL